MASRITAHAIAHILAEAGYTDATTGAAWTPGYRPVQASPRTVRIWHDGPDEQDRLDRYAETLRDAGYTVIPERTARKRPSLRITHP